MAANGESPLSFLLLFLYSLLKSGIEKGEWSTACTMPELCVSVQIRRLPAPSITSLPLSPPSQVILIKSVSLAW